jgi:hypothetical protein
MFAVLLRSQGTSSAAIGAEARTYAGFGHCEDGFSRFDYWDHDGRSSARR